MFFQPQCRTEIELPLQAIELKARNHCVMQSLLCGGGKTLGNVLLDD
jgi:hypothetical protein